MRNGSMDYPSCQLLCGYHSNELWKKAEVRGSRFEVRGSRVWAPAAKTGPQRPFVPLGKLKPCPDVGGQTLRLGGRGEIRNGFCSVGYDFPQVLGRQTGALALSDERGIDGENHGRARWIGRAKFQYADIGGAELCH